MDDSATRKPDVKARRALNRRRFLSLAGAGSAGFLASSLLPGCRKSAQEVSLTPARLSTTEARLSPSRPNVIIFLADDLGYADLGVQGCTDIPTPHIDTIAQNGVRFTSGYVTCPVCSPTRAGLLTGRYQQRFGHEYNPGPEALALTDFGLPLSEKTIADYFREAGYATGLVGKWHLGKKPPFLPQKRGFDEFFGFLGGSHSYLHFLDRTTREPILQGTTPVQEKEYLTDAFGREAVRFIERHQHQPFLLVVSFNAVHIPLEAPAEHKMRFRHIPDPRRRTLAAMLSSMDDNIGRVLLKVRDIGREEDTLVFFLSDNGAPPNVNGSSNKPLNGAKSRLLEGGIRVPFLMQWKATLPAGRVYERPVISLDILPTSLAAAGISAAPEAAPPLDGVDLVPFLSGRRAGDPHDYLFWRMRPQRAVRNNRYKLIAGMGREALYDLDNDIREMKNIRDKKSEVTAELRDALERWNSQLREPLWRQSGGRLIPG